MVEKATAGCCTTLAHAMARRLKKKYPDNHIEVVAHSGGRGSHVYVLFNRDPKSDIKKPESLNSDCFIMDAWLASLGYNTAVYPLHNFPPGFLEKLTLKFDNFDTPSKKPRNAM